MLNLFKRTKRIKALSISNEFFDSEIITNKKTAIVTFSAGWCGACKMQKPLINDLAHHHQEKDLIIALVDIDNETDLSKKFDIKSIPTTFVFKGGETVFRKSGLLSRGNLEQLVSELEKTSS